MPEEKTEEPEGKEEKTEPETTEEPKKSFTQQHIKYFFIFITVVTLVPILYLLRNDVISTNELTYKYFIGIEGLCIVWLVKQARIPIRVRFMKWARRTPFIAIVSTPGTIKFLLSDTRNARAPDGDHEYVYNDRPQFKRELYGAPVNVFTEGKARPRDLSVEGQEDDYKIRQELVRVRETISCPNASCEAHAGFQHEFDVPVTVMSDNPDSTLVRSTSILAERKGFEKAKLKMVEEDRTKKITLGLTFVILAGIGLLLYLQVDATDMIGTIYNKIDENTRTSSELKSTLLYYKDINQTGVVTPGRVEQIS